ncbi:MAG: hypothetical protein ABSG31_06165 [Tepidisphaeraceae bacterium]|jgi:hypothetical protein
MHPVRIENDQLSIEVWPHIGGKISSIFDKADQHELLFTYPAEIPEEPNYDTSYADHWCSGWDECFPAIAPSVYPRHPYQGISVPDHGELWGIPTNTAVPTKNGITCVWNGLRFGYRLARKLYLDGPSVIAEYTLNNLAPFQFRYVWSAHALLSLVTPVELVYEPAGEFRLSHDAEDTDINAPFRWPTGPSSENFAHPDMLPARKGWKMFSESPISAPMTVHYPKRNRSLRIEYSSEDGMSAYWGIWINTGGWAGNRHFALEPTTGRYDQIDRSIKDNSAGSIDPFGQRHWTVKMTV